MKLLACITGLAGIAAATSSLAADPAQRAAAIQEALDRGAFMVECKDTLCYNTQTHDVIAQSWPNGAYVVFPDDKEHQEDIQRAQRALGGSD